MNYKYKRGQIFGKRLKVPKYILNLIYNNNIYLTEYFKYKLDDKIPISCIVKSDRVIVERFGLEKLRDLDWELIKNSNSDINFREVLMSLDPKTEDINLALYEYAKDKIEPIDYSPRMAKVYPDRLFDVSIDDLDKSQSYKERIITNLKLSFNCGNVSLETIVNNWSLFKDMDLSFCLSKDGHNKNNITNNSLKDFMNNYGELVELIYNNGDIYTFIHNISSLPSEEEKHNYIKHFTDELLSNTKREYGDTRPPLELTDEEYKEIFKYSSLEEYLKSINEYRAKAIIEELKNLPEDYIFNIPIPFSKLINYDVLTFLGVYGLKNVVDFDNECGQYFTKNDCENLESMYEKYLHYSDSVWDPDKSIHTKKTTDENGNYIDRPYTKDEFYEAMKRMIIYGPTNGSSEIPNYQDITGEFRTRNKKLFISEQAPAELQRLFYTKSITPKVLLEHQDYIQFLEGKDLSLYLEKREVNVEGSEAFYGIENFYDFIESRNNFNGSIEFITDYCDILDIIFDYDLPFHHKYEIDFSVNDNMKQIKEKINGTLRQIIIEENLPYPEHIPEDLITEYPKMFLDKEAPFKLKEALYGRTITTEFILSDTKYIDYLKDIDLEVILKYMPINDVSKESIDIFRNNNSRKTNFAKALKQTFGEKEAFEVMLLYGKYIELAYEANNLEYFEYNSKYTKDDFLDELDNELLQTIIDGNMKYDENIPSHFKNNNQTLFLDPNVSKEIKDKFYNREFTTKDFDDNPELLDLFGETNIACGLSEDLSWIIPLFNDSDDFKMANIKRLKTATSFSKIQDEKMKKIFIDYVKNNSETITLDNLDDISEVLTRLEYSNSIELSGFKESVATQLLTIDNPIEKLDEIENIFLRNNLPLCGKMFLVFQNIYPDLEKEKKFSFNSNSRVAPQLKNDTLPDVGFHATSDQKRKIITFNDLLRTSIRSNEKSLIEYLDNIEKGNNLYLVLQDNNFDLSSLTKEDTEVLDIFVSHLETLYQNTKKGQEKSIDLQGLSLEEKLKILSKEFKETKRYDLKDRIVRSFCYTAGIKSFDELKSLIEESKIKQQDRVSKIVDSINENNGVFKIEEGDFVRCIGDINALNGSLKSGNYCKEHLGSFLGTSNSDTTPLDVDISTIRDTSNLPNAILHSPTGYGFGNIFVIMKKDNPNLNITRDSDGNLTGKEYDPNKVEVFGTKVDDAGYETHWGARTGISMADVDCIMYKEDARINIKDPFDENGNVNYEEKVKNKGELLKKIKFEIAKNGQYIPVIDFSGKLVYTKDEFIKLREKMQGLSYYGSNNYSLSDELINPEVEEIANSLTQESMEDTINKREKINSIVKEVLDEMGISMKDSIDGDLSPNSAEFIDTGSTGRKTNIPYAGDFDFFMRLDASIMRNETKANEFRERIREKITQYEHEETKVTNRDDLRFSKVKLDEDTVVDIDISFGVKTNKVRYSTDECLKDRLETIEKLYPDQYKYVVANIILAKQILKDPEVNAYKPRKSDESQGGLGGVGVENWILQNGGSFVEASKSFLDAALDKDGNMVPFDEFKEKYVVWNFGENHFAVRDGKYPHNNFIADNMNENGYQKMTQALKEHLKSMEMSKIENERKKR